MRLVYLSAAWCGVCQAKAPVAREAAAALGLPLTLLDFDRPEERDQAEALRIARVPTLALVDGERVRFRLVGRAIELETVMHLARRSGPSH
jgi:thiol-disulfide isomerase/thioredoxin